MVANTEYFLVFAGLSLVYTINGCLLFWHLQRHCSGQPVPIAMKLSGLFLE